MKRNSSIFAGFLLLIAALACLSSPVATPTPTAGLIPIQTMEPTATGTPVPAPTSTLLPTATTGVSPPPTSAPQNTATQVPTPTASPSVAFPNAARIQFAAGGTWIEVTGAGQANAATSFALAAMKGQVMSVSVFEGPGYYVTVQGPGGATLSFPNTDDFFWRGILPATQDYLVTVLPPRDGSFTLRVAINPPGQSTQVFTYDDAALSLRYPDSFAPLLYPYADQLRGIPALALNFQDSSFYDHTNLVEAYFVLSEFTDPNLVANCHQSSFEQEQSQGQETIHGYVFEKSTAGGVGAGNIYDLTIYRTVQENTCFEVVFFIHYGNIGNYPADIKEFDHEALLLKLMDVLVTFTMN